MSDRTNQRVFLTRQSPAYWRVTFNHPPLNNSATAKEIRAIWISNQPPGVSS
jgi:hypothetical protein